MLKQNPHPNIAEYYGCEIKAARVTGLCFKKYSNDLQRKLNAKSLTKASFLKSRQSLLIDAQRYLKGIEAGLDHLHSLRLSHNDVNPADIALDQDDEPVIIDFDSCSSHGTSLAKIKRTYGWHDEKVQIAQPENDFEALAKLRTWLTSPNPGDCQFMM